jgi:hypothetical protein
VIQATFCEPETMEFMAMPLNKVLALAGVGLALASCAAQGPTNNPLFRSMTWERYVGGDDIARACAAGQPARYRLVYNARQDRQQKTYDLSLQSDGSAIIEARVIGQGNLADPVTPLSITDPFGPWRGPQALYQMSSGEVDRFRAALDATGFPAPAPEGLFLRGDSFYWTASACRNGVFHFHAWGWPSPEFDRMAMPLIEAMMAFDKTGVETVRPYEIPLPPYSALLDERGQQAGAGSAGAPHRFQVGKNGLRYSQGILFN